MVDSNIVHVQRVFLLSKSLSAVEDKEYTIADICAAAERTAGFETVDGAQRIGGLWTLYPRTAILARMSLFTRGIVL